MDAYFDFFFLYIPALASLKSWVCPCFIGNIKAGKKKIINGNKHPKKILNDEIGDWVCI